MHKAATTVDERGTIYNKSSQICAYADDIVIMARTKKKHIEVYGKLEAEAEQIVLIVNETKTKYMIMSASESRRKLEDLVVGNKTLQGVTNFRYFGNVIRIIIMCLI